MALDRAAVAFVRKVDASDDTVVIVRVDAIGDFVIWLASAHALVAYHRPRRIVLIANQLFADLARASGIFDEVIPLDVRAFKKNRSYRFSTLRQVRRLGAKIAVHPCYSRSFWTGDALIRATDAADRIGQYGDLNNIQPWQKRLSDRWYTQLTPAVAASHHELQRNANFLLALGAADGSLACARLEPSGDLPAALSSSRPYFVIVPGAGSTRRMWPTARFSDLARRVAIERDLRLVICGSASERDLAAEISAQVALEDTLVLTGRTSLPELVEVIRGATLTVANDSAAIHIAVAVGSPSLCLLGGGHFARFLPYPERVENVTAVNRPACVHAAMSCFNCNWQCTQPHAPLGPYPCIEAISFEAATSAAFHQLKRRDAL